MIDPSYYKSLEAELLNIKNALANCIPAQNQQQFSEFINAGEYGLAFEEITGSIIDEQHTISRELFNQIASLADKMQISDAHWKPIIVSDP